MILRKDKRKVYVVLNATRADKDSIIIPEDMLPAGGLTKLPRNQDNKPIFFETRKVRIIGIQLL